MKARMSREMEAMMDLMQSQITRAISSAISERIIPEIQNMVENLPLGQHDVELGTSLNEEGIRNAWKNTNIRLTKKDSRSACDLRDHTDVSPYNHTIQKLMIRSEDEIMPISICVKTAQVSLHSTITPNVVRSYKSCISH